MNWNNNYKIIYNKKNKNFKFLKRSYQLLEQKYIKLNNFVFVKSVFCFQALVSVNFG